MYTSFYQKTAPESIPGEGRTDLIIKSATRAGPIREILASQAPAVIAGEDRRAHHEEQD
jgi:hypothetical protein